MANFILILVCLLAGLALRRTGKFAEGAGKTLITFVIHVSFPALMFLQVPAFLATAGLSSETWILVSMPWLMALLAGGVFGFLGRVRGWPPATIGAIVLTAGFSNTSFVGFPVLESLLGPSSVKLAVILDQAGCFFAMSTLGLMLAAFASGAALTWREILRRVLSFPPFIALIAAALVYLIHGEIGACPVRTVLERLGATLVPIALVAVGAQLHVSREVLRKRSGDLVLGLVFKLIIAPLAFGLFYVGVIGSRTPVSQVTLLESAMAPMITGAVIATQYDLDVELANLMVGVGIPLSLLTVPLVHWLTRGLFTT